MQIDHLRFYLEEKEFLKEFINKSRSEKIPIIRMETGSFLEFAVMISKPSNILEIGCGNGFSTYFLVKNMSFSAKYTGIDLNSKRLINAESIIREKFTGKELEFINGNALKIIPELNHKYDLVFIDAAKFEYPDYLKVLKNKFKKGALIIADNIIYSEKIFSSKSSKHDKKSVEGIKQYIKIITSEDDIYNSSLLNIGDGIAISICGDDLNDK